MLYEILLLKAFRPNFAKMRQRSPLRNFITFLAKKQAPIHVSAVSSSFALCRLPGKPFWRFRMWPPPRSSRRWPSSCLDKIPVRLPEVELVRLDFLWQHAEALLIELQLHGEVGRFVVGVPTEMVDVGVTVHDAGANLRTELDLGLRLAPDNRTEVRLVDADDASLYPQKITNY